VTKKISECPSCGSRDVVTIKKDIELSSPHLGTVDNVTATRCTVCGEEFLTPERFIRVARVQEDRVATGWESVGPFEVQKFEGGYANMRLLHGGHVEMESLLHELDGSGCSCDNRFLFRTLVAMADPGRVRPVVVRALHALEVDGKCVVLDDVDVRDLMIGDAVPLVPWPLPSEQP
jgi:YgiT-type zinc finger domain-containing protein